MAAAPPKGSLSSDFTNNKRQLIASLLTQKPTLSQAQRSENVLVVLILLSAVVEAYRDRNFVKYLTLSVDKNHKLYYNKVME